MQAIETKYHGATNTKGSRISATSESGIRVYIGYPHELDTAEAHAKAAHELCAKLNWSGTYHGGATKDGYVFVSVDNGPTFSIPRTFHTGQKCSCRKGQERDNCPACEGSGLVIDFQAMRNAHKATA